MNRTSTILYTGLAGALVVAGTSLFGVADAAAQEVSFKGKRINAIIGSSAGGGTDGTTRLVGRFLQKYLPGKPRIVFRNMPAGHGVQAVNYFNNVVKKDGTAWLGGSSSYVDANNLRKSVVKYDPRKFLYVGAVARGGSVMTMRKSKVANIYDKSKPPVIVGAVDGSRSWGQMMLWGKDKLGWNIKFVIGYPGAPSLTLAARRGEVDAFGTSSIGLHETMAKTGDFVSFVQLGEVNDGKIVPRVSFPNVPVMPDLMKGKLSGVALETFQFWTKTNQIDKWYALPPGTPDNVVKVYREAYTKTVKDPEFIKFGRFQFSKDFSAQTADDIFDLINSTSYPKAEIFTYIHDMAVRHGLPGEPLSDAEMAKLAKELGGIETVNGTKLDKIQRGGRILHFMNKGKAQKVKVSGSRTKVYIGGKKTKRGNLKPGMACDISFMGSEASEVKCK
jgi:tripartite-type tricarboxylate transporter receptor subunit TctC